MKRNPIIVSVAVGALVFAIPAIAYAGPTPVVVAGPESDPVASHLVDELTALGFQPTRAFDDGSCERDAIAASMRSVHAPGATCSNGTSVTVYGTGPSGVRVVDVVEPGPNDESPAEVLAMRAAEATRASIELAATEPRPPAPQPPQWSTSTWDSSADRPPPEREAPAERHFTPTLVVGGGMAAVMGADAESAALDIEMELRVYRHLAIAARVDVPLTPLSGTLAARPDRAVSVLPGLAGIGPVLPLAPAQSRFIPRIGGGLGIAWLSSHPLYTAIPVDDDIASPMAYANAAMALRLAGPVRLVLEGLFGSTAHRMVVRADGQHMAYWGHPFGTIAFRTELTFR